MNENVKKKFFKRISIIIKILHKKSKLISRKFS